MLVVDDVFGCFRFLTIFTLSLGRTLFSYMRSEAAIGASLFSVVSLGAGITLKQWFKHRISLLLQQQRTYAIAWTI
jgi:hypothetical protein